MITILNACVIGYGVHVHAHSQLVNKLSLCHIKSYLYNYYAFNGWKCFASHFDKDTTHSQCSIKLCNLGLSGQFL